MIAGCRGARRTIQPLTGVALGAACATLWVALAAYGGSGATATSPALPSPATTASAPTPTMPATASFVLASPAPASLRGAPNAPPARLALTLTVPSPGGIWSLPGDSAYPLSGNTPIRTGLAPRVSIARSSDDVRVELALPASAEVGTLTLPADKRFPGRRDLRFALAGPDGEPFAGASAAVIVQDVTILGPR